MPNLQQLIVSTAGRVEQVFALTNSGPTMISFPAQMQPIPETSMAIRLAQDSLLTITYSMRVFLIASGRTFGPPGPMMLVRCELDGVSCAPNGNDIEFGNNLGWGDARAFTWVVHYAKHGIHTVAILGGMANPNNAESGITNRSLIVNAAKFIPGRKGGIRERKQTTTLKQRKPKS